MNRIIQHVRKTSQIPEAALEIPEFPVPQKQKELTDPSRRKEPLKVCSFCGCSIEGIDFRAYSRLRAGIAPAAICGQCLDQLSVMNTFAKTFDIFWQEPADYAPLTHRILKAMAGEAGTSRMKRSASGLAVMLAKRSASLIAGTPGKVCSRTGVSLELPRIALIGKNAKACEQLLRVACQQTGTAFFKTAKEHLKSGVAFHELIRFHANGEETWARHGLMFCDGYVKPQTGCAVVFACETTEGLPEDVQVLHVDGFDADDLC